MCIRWVGDDARDPAGSTCSTAAASAEAGCSEEGIDERRHRRTLCKDKQGPETRQYDDERQKPQLLTFSEEQPQLFEKVHVKSPS
jgi:hypothetical protein